tara:strand:+ start:567 stop:875 length:309 start_codon:yes stop_codon:yes gene_type:complete
MPRTIYGLSSSVLYLSFNPTLVEVFNRNLGASEAQGLSDAIPSVILGKHVVVVDVQAFLKKLVKVPQFGFLIVGKNDPLTGEVLETLLDLIQIVAILVEDLS